MHYWDTYVVSYEAADGKVVELVWGEARWRHRKISVGHRTIAAPPVDLEDDVVPLLVEAAAELVHKGPVD